MPLFTPRVRPTRRNSVCHRHVESLESRQLLSATVVAAPPAVAGVTGEAFTVDLTSYIDDPAADTQIRFATELGNIDIQLFDQQKPLTVANFLNYVRQGRLDTTIIHRATEPSSGLEVIQGGGYKPPTFEHIPTDAGVVNEAPLDPVLPNSRGTISMARTNEPNSGTSEFFLNSVNNSSLDPSAQPPGYAVFGEVINGTIAVVDAIQGLPTFAFGSPFGEIPLRNYTQANFEASATPTAENFVSIVATTLPKLTYQVSSSNPAVAAATLNGNKLTLQYGSAVGTADITVTGTDGQGQSVTQTFAANVAATPSVTVNLGTGAAKSVTFTDADGTVATISHKGAGTAAVSFEGTGLTQATAKGKTTVTGAASVDNIVVTGATSATAVTITGKGGNGVVDVAGFTADGPLKSLAAKNTSLTGTLSATGSVGKLDLGSATNADITLGGAATDKPATVNIGAASGTDITSTAPLKSVTAASFTAGAARGVITAPALDKLTSKGDFVQDVTTSGAIKAINVTGNFTGDVSADTIAALTVRGAMSGSTIAANRAFAAGEKPIGKVSVSGAITNSVVRAAGNIVSVAAGSIAGSTVYAGIAPAVGVSTLPAAAADFASQATVSSLKVKTTTADTNIAAFNLGKLSLGTVTAANTAEAFGLSAGVVAAVTGSVSGAKLALKNLDTPADVTAQTTGVTLQDFQIVLV